MADEEDLKDATHESKMRPLAQDRHCFIVMPYGRTTDEIRWFKGWYETVIRAAVTEAGYVPILSANEQRPSAINDEIRTHLAFDRMVVVDLGGATPDTEPNPNVMYELGIRHALNLPVVLMAWEGQRLPFDISNQRVIVERRELLDIQINRQRLVSFIREAELGNFYRPMEAVGRVGALELASAKLDPKSLLGNLIGEVRELREQITRPNRYDVGRYPRRKVKDLLGPKPERKNLLQIFQSNGGTLSEWARLVGNRASPDLLEAARTWSYPDREHFVLSYLGSPPQQSTLTLEPSPGGTEALLDPKSDVKPS